MQLLGYAAIVAGTASGGVFVAWKSTHPWLIGGGLTAVAIAGVVSSHSIASVRSKLASTDENALIQPRIGDVWKSINDRTLLRDAMIVYGFLWLVAGLYHPIINVFCRVHLGLTASTTSLVLAASVAGIAAGCLIAGLAERKFSVIRFLPVTAVALVMCQIMLAVLVWTDVAISIVMTSGILFVLVLQWWQMGIGSMFLVLALFSIKGTVLFRPKNTQLIRNLFS